MVTNPRLGRRLESSGDRRPQLPVGIMTVQAYLAFRVKHRSRESSKDARLLGGSCKLVPATPAMMMRRVLFAVGGKLISITLVVTGCLGRRGKANFSLGGVRQSARPHHQDEHQNANEGFAPSHQPRPVAVKPCHWNAELSGQPIAMRDRY